MLIEFFKLTPESIGLIYGLSYFFIGTTSLFLFSRKTTINKSLYFWLFLWGSFYGIYEILGLVDEIKENAILDLISQYFKFFAYYFLANILIFGLSDDSSGNLSNNKKIIISFFVLLILLVFQIFAKKFLFIVPSVTAFFIAKEFYKIYRDSFVSKRVRKSALIISLLFLLFGSLTVLYSLNIYGDGPQSRYFFRIARSVTGLLISLNLLYYFLENLSSHFKPKYYKVSRNFITSSFIIFIFIIFISNKIIVDAKKEHHEHMKTFRTEELSHTVDLYNKASEQIFFLNRAMAESAQVSDFIDNFYNKEVLVENDNNENESSKNLVYKLFDSINKHTDSRVFYILNLNGDVLISSNRNDTDSFEGNNYAFRPYFKEAISGQNSIYYAKGVSSGRKGGYYSSPIYSDDNQEKISGVIVIKINENELREFIVSEDGSFLLDSEGKVFIAKQADIVDRSFFVKEKNTKLNVDNTSISGFNGFEPIGENIMIDASGDSYFFRIIDVKPEGWKIGYFGKHDHIDKIILEKLLYILLFITLYMTVFYYVIAYFIDTLILQITENKYKDIYNNSNDLMFSFNSSGNITFVNPAWKRNMGYKEGDLSKIKIKDTISKDNIKMFENVAKKVFRGDDKKAELEIKFVNKNKEVVWGVGSIEKEIREDNFYLLRGIFRNNTEEKNKQEEINNKNNELSFLLKKSENDKVFLEKQRLATQNILEDISETKLELVENNKNLEKRSEEIKNLAILSGEISNITEIEKIIEKIKNFIYKNIALDSLSVCTDFLENQRVSCKIYLKEKLSENFLESVKNKNSTYFLKNFSKKYTCTEVQIIGETSKTNKKKLGSIVHLDLKSGNKYLGFMSIASSEEGVYNDDLVNFLRSIASLFSSAIVSSRALIKAEHSKTESLLRALEDGIILFENPNKVILFNSSAEKLTSITKDNKSLENFYKETLKYTLKEKIENVFKDKKIIKIEELEYFRNKQNLIYNIFIIPVSDFKGKGVGVAMIIRDITKDKYIDQMKTEFVSVASHQLRTPLTAIKLFTSMLVDEQVGKISPDQKKYLSIVYDSTERMVNLVNDLLNVTRIESGRLIVSPEKTELKTFLSSLISEAKSLAYTKKIDIKFMYKTKLSSISIDKSLLRQVYHNLLTNAIRYSKENSKVVVEVLADKNNFIITVTDSGIGIPKDVQARMFEKFFRADNAVKIATEGTGLGLYVSKMIVESSGGKIWFESNLNKGTKFFVSIPKNGMKEKKGERGLTIS